MTPPPAEGFAARLVVGPALRTQSDRRLVNLVRDGYESAFEEIVRRYGKPLQRYAGAIVAGRAEDVTQDAFSKALMAMRRDTGEIELRPWLFRIVRNTALNDLRDRPPSADDLAEALVGGGRSAAEELERREELTDLMERLRALPEPQRAAIVMRELEGLGHEEIAAALGLSGGAARQAIYRARQALRDGAGMLLPLPLLKALIDHGGEVAAAGAASGGAVAAGGAGASVAVKAGVVTAVLAGSVGTGIALKERDRGAGRTEPASAATVRVVPAGPAGAGAETGLRGGEGGSRSDDPVHDAVEEGGGDRRREDDPGDGSGHGPRQSLDAPSEDDRDGGSNRGPGRRGHEPEGADDSPRGPGHGGRPEDGSGSRSGRGGGESEGGSGNGHGGPGPSSDTGSGNSGRGSGEERPPPPPIEGEEHDGGGDSGSSGPGSGDAGSDGDDSGSDSSGHDGAEERP